MELAGTIAKAVKDHDPGLVLFGLRRSCSIMAAAEMGLPVAHEIFADRTYLEDGSLTPRSEANALIHDPAQMLSQLKRMQELPDTDTVCIHGDGPEAIEFVRLIHQSLRSKQ
jgi:UPF0271 protein